MVSIIKNQLLKHLSRYTKNLSADKINLSTFKGEGELTNLELDEQVLTELLELPAWIRLTSAWCNRVSFRIPWTKLKSVPMFLTLDEVHITVETCDSVRIGSESGALSGLTGPQGKYSFIHKVIDGMTIIVNTVSVTFKSPAFEASVQISRIRVESKSPDWTHADLRMTRLKHPDQGTLLIFKELEWQTMRIEAKSTLDSGLTPLRLLTNQANCRITIKKRLSDCMILGSRLCLILDELLWVLTDSQLKAALHFVDSLTELVRTTTEATQKTKAARKLELLPEYQAQIAQSAPKPRTTSANCDPMAKFFSKFDVLETSYHFLSQGIDLHLCDDPGDGRSCHPHLKDGAALQISLSKFQVDYYPYHLARGNRKHWPKYREAAIPPAQWLQQSLSSFTSSLLDLVDPSKTHTPLGRTTNNQNSSPNSMKSDATSGSPLLSDSNVNSPPRSPKDNINREEYGLKSQVLSQLSKLMSTCVILRIQDFTLYRTTTSKKTSHQEFISDDKDRYSLPEDLPTLHAEFTYYYYPRDDPYPLPPPKFYVHMNPVQIKFDIDTCLWFNSFALHLHQSLLNAAIYTAQQNQAAQIARKNDSELYIDVKCEAIMLRIIFEAGKEYASQKDRPASLHIQISRACISNVRERDGSSRTDLATCLDKLQNGGLVFGEDFPSSKNDYNVVANKFLQHVNELDAVRPQPPILSHLPLAEAKGKLYRELLWVDSRDVWCLRLDPLWADFFGARSVGRARPVPLLDAVPVTVWLYKTPKEQTKLWDIKDVKRNKFKSTMNVMDDEIMTMAQFEEQNSNPSNIFSSPSSNINQANQEPPNADIYALASISNLISVQINHYQFLFLLRLLEEVSELTTFLSIDSSRILKQDLESSVVMASIVPQIEVTFVMPSFSQSKESSGGDMESMIPDSASIADDLHLAVSGNCTTPWPTNNSSISSATLKKSNQQQSESLASPLYSPESVTEQAVSQLGTLDLPQDMSTPSSQHSILTGKNIMDRVTQNVLPPKTSDISFPSIPKDINAGLSTMKKGFTSLMNKMDMKQSMTSMDDMLSDTMSIRSDVSSDSENYIMVAMQNEQDERSTQCIDAMFSLNTFSSGDSDAIKASPIEMANEVLVPEEPATNVSTPTEQSQDSCKRKDLISISTFKLSHVEFVQQSCGFRSNTKVQLCQVSCEECNSIPWDELQSKFSSRSRATCLDDSFYNQQQGDNQNQAGANQTNSTRSNTLANSARRPRIRLRLDRGPCRVINAQGVAAIQTPKDVLSWFEDNLEVRVKDLDLSLNMSTITGMTDLIEDEIVPKPLPVQISLDNTCLRLVEDRPPANITSPGSLPLDVSIEEMNISRDATGVFKILKGRGFDFLSGLTADGKCDLSQRKNEKALATQKMMTDQLKSDNEELRSKLTAMEGITEQNRSLQKYKDEVSVLKACLATAQEDVKALLSEKQTLLDTVRVLQEQLGSLDHGYQNWNSKR